MKTSIKRVPLETKEQQEFIKWANKAAYNLGYGPEFVGAFLFAIPNGGSRHMLEAKRLKAEGVRAGVPDLMFPVPVGKYHSLFIEMKRSNGVPSDVSKEQKEWHLKLINKGFAVAVAFGFMHAVQIITDYLRGKEIIYECKRSRS